MADYHHDPDDADGGVKRGALDEQRGARTPTGDFCIERRAPCPVCGHDGFEIERLHVGIDDLGTLLQRSKQASDGLAIAVSVLALGSALMLLAVVGSGRRCGAPTPA